MITTKSKSKIKKIVPSEIIIVNPNLNETQIQKRKMFFENVLSNLNNNPLRIVMV